MLLAENGSHSHQLIAGPFTLQKHFDTATKKFGSARINFAVLLIISYPISCLVSTLLSPDHPERPPFGDLFYLFILFISLLKNYNVVKENK